MHLHVPIRSHLHVQLCISWLESVSCWRRAGATHDVAVGGSSHGPLMSVQVAVGILTHIEERVLVRDERKERARDVRRVRSWGHRAAHSPTDRVALVDG